MVDYDALKLADTAAAASPYLDGPDWAFDEGIDHDGMMKFCLEAAKESLRSLPFPPGVMPDYGHVMFGMIYGIRLVNLLNENRT